MLLDICKTPVVFANPDNVRRNLQFIEEPIDWQLVKEVQEIIGDRYKSSIPTASSAWAWPGTSRKHRLFSKPV